MAEISIVADDLIGEFRRMYPREFEIAALTVTNRKLREQVDSLEAEKAADPSSFWAGTDKKVPLRAEKE